MKLYSQFVSEDTPTNAVAGGQVAMYDPFLMKVSRKLGTGARKKQVKRRTGSKRSKGE